MILQDFEIQILKSNRSQIVILNTGRGKHSKYLPYAFTEQGVAILSGILNSNRAIKMPARLTPVGREHSYYAGFCRSKKSAPATNRY
ncbi:ORF6N domain-containing protein [Agriterribacter sp.]|uniref:ORF6N domain-containing protein n=1 Tax=Agriterribacter sp. TaxID=2821509 RepID=UPI002BF3472C|nr:ORF6N domain-containing protein [Agriterribacter sp.]HRO44828.1 ORF6N domain-containing protein [Agriterribacter sp.]HRQ18040.1 ORF6N domain-containing protein [Agriterribacter sp.]